MEIKLFSQGGRLTINILAHHYQFKKWWNKIQQSSITFSAAKYARTRKVFNSYVIDANPDLNDVIQHIYDFRNI